MILRSDYTSLNDSFSNTSTYPAAEVLVCPWWASTLVKQGSCFNVTVKTVVNSLCESVAGTNAVSWPTYTFVPYTQNSVNMDINLLSYIRYLFSANVLANNSYVVGMQAGFRLYSGKGSFTYIDLSLLYDCSTTA
jgi:hypothetical protein